MSSRLINRFYLKRIELGRRENKRLKDNARKKVREIEIRNNNPRICPFCGCGMTWCESCQVWSSNCCQDYGTCLCS